VIRLVSKNRRWGAIRISNALRYFFGLVASVGLPTALRVGVQTLRRLLGSEGFRLSFGRSSPESLTLPNGPPGWRAGIEQLIKAAQEKGYNDATTDELRMVVEQASASRNDADSARVTILIPTYEHFEQALQCIKSLFAWNCRVNFKILVGDDSRERSLAPLASITGVDYIKNDRTLGYLRNVQQLATKSSTDYLLILNQDTLVLPGLVDELVRHLDEHPKVGVVSPVVLDPDLNILEIGGEIVSSGAARHRYRGISGSDYQHLYTQSVDYVSGCAMLIRASLWSELGGFDDRFNPGYYEDADFCVRAHLRGHEVAVVSSAFVVHLEGTSHGRFPQDRRSTKNFQQENAAKFREKHFSRQSEDNPHVELPSLNRARLVGELVLVFDSIPDPQSDGGSADADNFVRHAISLGYKVTAMSLNTPSAAQTYNWRSLGVRCLPEITEIKSQLNTSDSTTLVSFGLPAGQYVASLVLPVGVRWIHYSLDVFTRRLETLLQVQNRIEPTSQIRWNLGLPREPEPLWKVESEVLSRADLVLYASEQDHEFVKDRVDLKNGQTFQVLKGTHFVGDTEPPASQNIGLVGSLMHQPNIDALEYCLHDIWPAIRDVAPQARLLVWGSGATASIITQCHNTPGVEFRGWFRDWQQVASSIRFVISPLRYGAGAKNRTVSSILSGRPVVGSSISFDGLPRFTDLSPFIAASASDYATISKRLLESDAAWSEAITQERKLTETSFNSSYERELVCRVLTRHS
jgi:GT2 family glycosyltransferase